LAQLAHAQLLWQTRQYEAALEGCLSLRFDGITDLDPQLLSETQAIVCQCQHALGTFDHAAPPKIAAVWKDALDRCAKRPPAIADMRTEMFKAAWRDEYWGIAQQVRWNIEFTSELTEEALCTNAKRVY
jgi:hypothetical protein